MPWLDNKAPDAPELKAEKKADALQLEWSTVGKKQDNITYAVYRFNKDETINLDKSEHIISVQKGNKFIAKKSSPKKNEVYVVTALDRLWNESEASNMVND
jgi:hypothetical protein